MKFSIVSGKYGSVIAIPVMFATRAEAIKYVRERVAKWLKNDYKMDGIDTDNIDEVLGWGEDSGYCKSYNCEDGNGNKVINAVRLGDNWTEFMITEMDTSKLKEEDFMRPVLTATDIRWDVDIDEGFDKLDDMPFDKAAEYLGVPKETYANMTTSERHDYAYDVWRHNRKSLSEFVGAPSEVTLSSNVLWDEDSISEYLSDEYGWCHEGFKITCNYSVEEMEDRIHYCSSEIDGLENAIRLVENEERGWVIPEFFKEDNDDLSR